MRKEHVKGLVRSVLLNQERFWTRDEVLAKANEFVESFLNSEPLTRKEIEAAIISLAFEDKVLDIREDSFRLNPQRLAASL